MKIILASQSPRRKSLLKKLLQDLGTLPKNFTIIPAHIDESRQSHERPIDYAIRMALEKAQSVATGINNEATIIAADTIVAMGDKIYHKPVDQNDIVAILSDLSGRTHKVISGFAIIEIRPSFPQAPSGKRVWSGSETTTVYFKKLSTQQIIAYSRTKEPLDKAGAYAIQGRAKAFVKGIKGSYSNVVGLPIEKISRILTKIH